MKSTVNVSHSKNLLFFYTYTWPLGVSRPRWVHSTRRRSVLDTGKRLRVICWQVIIREQKLPSQKTAFHLWASELGLAEVGVRKWRRTEVSKVPRQSIWRMGRARQRPKDDLYKKRREKPDWREWEWGGNIISFKINLMSALIRVYYRSNHSIVKY